MIVTLREVSIRIVNVVATVESSAVGAPAELMVSSLTVRFGALTALDAVDLTVRAGEVVAIAGENGAGKTTLIRAIGGDLTPVAGAIRLGGKPVAPDPVAAARLGVRIVWQDLSLSDNLDVASNVMLGNERLRHAFSDVFLHKDSARLLRRLGIPLRDTTRPVKSLSGGQRQMVAVARAMAHGPRLLLLDEPTASLGVRESALVEELITRLREQGTTILLSCHDTGQMFRLADRIVVLRYGRVVAEVSPSEVHPDDVVALMSGQAVDSSARRQLTRLHRLTGRLVSSDPSSSLSLILSALGAALGSERLCIHLLEESQPGVPRQTDGSPRWLVCAASFGVPDSVLAAWSRLPYGAAGGPVGLAAATQRPVIEDNVRAFAGSWARFGDLPRSAKVASSWSVPVLGPGGLLGVITVFRGITGKPQRDDLDLAALYAGYAASAIERDRLLDQVTARNQVLETIREVLQTLAGPVPVADGLGIALSTLRRGLGADEVALATQDLEGVVTCRAYAVDGGDAAAAPTVPTAGYMAPAGLLAVARAALGRDGPDGVAAPGVDGDGPGGVAGADGPGGVAGADGPRSLSVRFAAPDGQTVLVACWHGGPSPDDATALIEDAAHSLRMALEREQALGAQQEAMALRHSQELQYAFLRRLSHELRTPLTAITGYASSLLQKDVTWDAESQQRFLSRIAAESGRLGRLVNDLLDFSAIESGIFRLQSDWCDISLVVDAAVACLPPASAPQVEVKCSPGLPTIWADHDRLEQVFVNLLSNALGHNPPGTRVLVTAETAEPGMVTVKVADDGQGMPPDLARSPTEAARRPRPRGSGAGLGLSIASGIVTAHGGHMALEQVPRGTCFRITLPIEPAKPTETARPADSVEPAEATEATEPAEPARTTAPARKA
jgi:signal transduction histidine kinase/ABC-type multidrug transport system ATPase subunit/GAF domain-containing protein